MQTAHSGSRHDRSMKHQQSVTGRMSATCHCLSRQLLLYMHTCRLLTCRLCNTSKVPQTEVRACMSRLLDGLQVLLCANHPC